MRWIVAIFGALIPLLPAQPQVITTAADQAVVPAELQRVRILAERGIERLGPLIPGTPKRSITFVVHSRQASVPREQLDSLHPGVPGYARLQLDEIHLVLDQIGMEPPNDLRTTVDHELVHILLDQHVGVHGLHVPRWFHEGLAQELASGLYLGVREEDLAYRVQTRTYIPFASLCDSFPRDDPARLALAYGQSFSFVAYLRGRVGLPALLAVARDCGPELPFSTALARRMKTAQIEYELEWCDYILHRSGAGYRVVLRNCFLLLMIVLAGPLLALAVARRRTREEALKRRMVREEAIAVAAAESPGPERPAAQGEDRSAADRRRDGRDSGDDWDGDGWDGDDWDGDGDTWNEAAWSDDELDDAEWDDAEWDDDEWDGDERDDRDGADPDGPGDLPPRPGRSVE